MKLRFALPAAMAALLMVGTAPIASAKMSKKYHRHMVSKAGPGAQPTVGLRKQTKTGGPAGGAVGQPGGS